MRVLHIEDRMENRRLVRRLLERDGVEVLEAADGLSGLDRARACVPDLILIDIDIPQLNGYELVSRMRSDVRLVAVPIIAITGIGDRERALALGFDDFIQKPIQIADFMTRLNRVASLGRKVEGVEGREAILKEHTQALVAHLEQEVRGLTQANEQLRALDQVKLDVLRNVSHELMTPLTPIVGYVGMMLNEELGPLTDDQISIMGKAQTSLNRLRERISLLLAATRFVSEDVLIKPNGLDLGSVLEATRERMAAKAKAQCTDIVLEPQSTTLSVWADEEHLKLALDAVLENAIKFSEKNGTVRFGASEAPDEGASLQHVIIWVQDEGMGIPDALKERVFEPFFQVDGSVTRAHGGAGLGLAVARRIVERHGGHIKIQNGPRHGSRVLITLPAQPPVKLNPVG